MKKFLKIIAVALLLLNSVAALFGGGNLIEFPDGSSLMISPDWLKHTPFHNFLIPGIVLFITDGVFGVVVLAVMLSGNRRYPLFIITQGVLLCGWIIVQVMLIRTIIGLHIFMFVVGLILTICGILLARLNKQNNNDEPVED